uniref:Uncharacterized protein n=1 Tax=Glossina austeni TaxID=7395 RepID=A0A1A9UIL5_GLOAU
MDETVAQLEGENCGLSLELRTVDTLSCKRFPRKFFLKQLRNAGIKFAITVRNALTYAVIYYYSASLATEMVAHTIIPLQLIQLTTAYLFYISEMNARKLISIKERLLPLAKKQVLFYRDHVLILSFYLNTSTVCFNSLSVAAGVLRRNFTSCAIATPLLANIYLLHPNIPSTR